MNEPNTANQEFAGRRQQASALRRLCWMLLCLAATLMVGRAQPVTITSADMFNQVGQYYLAYANYYDYNAGATNSVEITPTMLGTPSATAQFWDWSAGPTNVIYRFDYLPATSGTNGADFVAAGANVVQMQNNLTVGNDISFLYMKVDPAKGQLDYGFWDPNFSASQPESVFQNPIQDFPNSITYGSTWGGSTIFTSVLTYPGAGDLPDQLTYTSSDVVDAFGYVQLPAPIGLQPCIRVHESVEYDISIDFSSITGQSGYSSIGSEYIVNYYWLVPGYGMAVQINSNEASSPTGLDSLPGGATSLVRMFQAYHPAGSGPTKTYIQNFKLTMEPTYGFLSWTALSGTNNTYTVQYTTNLVGGTNWQTLTTTASNFALDPAAANKTSPRRLYRVLAPSGSK